MTNNTCPICGLPSELITLKDREDVINIYQCDIHGQFGLTSVVDKDIRVQKNAELRLKVENMVLKRTSQFYGCHEEQQYIAVIREQSLEIQK